MSARLPALLATAAAVSASLAPAASAAPAERILQDKGSEPVAVPVRVVEVQADPGFDWGDAGIGATGVLALAAIGTGAALAAGARPSVGGLRAGHS